MNRRELFIKLVYNAGDFALQSGRLNRSDCFPKHCPDFDQTRMLRSCPEGGRPLPESATVIRRVVTDKPWVAFTFDDGFAEKPLAELLKICRERQVSINLFPAGKMFKYYPYLWQEFYKDGHFFGNHTYNHFVLTDKTEDEVVAQLTAWEEEHARQFGSYPSFRVIRPPAMMGFLSGEGDSHLRRLFAKRGYYYVAHYTADSCSYVSGITSERVYANIVPGLVPGGIVLQHIVGPEIACFPRVLEECHRRGLEPVLLPRLLTVGR